MIIIKKLPAKLNYNVNFKKIEACYLQNSKKNKIVTRENN